MDIIYPSPHMAKKFLVSSSSSQENKNNKIKQPSLTLQSQPTKPQIIAAKDKL
jgi:hypothetical protein